MSVENVKQFYEAISRDEAMKQTYMESYQKYQGQPMDEETALSLVGQEGLALAQQMGYEFTLDDLKSYGTEMKQAKMNFELSDEEMQAVAGGSLICVAVGFNDDSTATRCGGACAFLGFNDTGGFCCIIGAGTK